MPSSAPLATWKRLTQPRLQMAKADQQLAALVPKRQPPASQALAQSDDLGDPIEFRGSVETVLKAVVGHPAAQVMHMVEADVARKPLQYGRKLEV